jgi:hypothetical protein
MDLSGGRIGKGGRVNAVDVKHSCGSWFREEPALARNQPERDAALARAVSLRASAR